MEDVRKSADFGWDVVTVGVILADSVVSDREVKQRPRDTITGY